MEITTLKQAFEIFERNYPRWNSNRSFKPSEILKIIETTGVTPRQIEDAINGIYAFYSDNDLHEVITRLMNQLGTRLKFTGMRIKKDDYTKYYTGTKRHCPEAYGNDGMALSHALHELIHIITHQEIRLNLHLPDQIIEFYEACDMIIAHFSGGIGRPTLI